MKPDASAAYYNRGYCKKSLGDLKGAIEDYNKAIELEPDTSYYFNRGMAKYGLEDYVGAISDFNTLLKFKPGDIRAIFFRGLAHYMTKDLREAQDDYTYVLLHSKKPWGELYLNRA
ncbi:MAG TPA: tetratricopeptide repeat protein, partial [Bacteroidales bacterium]|nr:tetratricopeptide repeat protein [Bacteroidales bacterium]